MDMLWFDYGLPCLWAFLACVGFTFVFNIHGVGKLICGVGGALGWLVYLLAGSTILAAFLASAAIGLYAEVMARVRKCPVTGYLLVAIFPLVPGGGIYYTMEYAMRGEVDQFLLSFLHTLGLAGAIAVGVLLVSSAVRMWTAFRRQTPLPRKEDRP